VLAAVPDPVCVFSADDELVWSNEPLRRVLGDPACTVRGCTLPELFGEPDATAVRQALDAVRSGSASATAEVSLLPADGPPRPCTFTARPFAGEAGSSDRVVGVARMVPLSGTQSDTLRRERDRLAALYTGLPSPVVHYEVQDGTAVARGVNAAFEEVFGVSRTDVVGQDLDALLVSDDQRSEAETLTRKAVKEGSVQAEVVRETKDGSRHFRLDSVLFSGGETPQGYAIYTDITEQKEREQTLRAEQNALRSMYRITADQEASFEDKVQRLIQLGCEYLGLPYGFLTRITEESQHIRWASGDHPLLQPGESCPLTQSYCRKTIQKDSLLAVQDAAAEGWDGDPAYATFNLGTYIGSQILVDGSLYGTLCFAATDARDTSFTERERTFVELMTRWASYELEQRRATEQLERQNERLDNFAGLVAHDLRNPLNVAKGRLELTEEENDLSHLSSVGRALDRMDEIIEDLLALTWGGQDLADDDLERCDLARLAMSCWEHADVPPDRLETDDAPYVYADEARLQRLLENLFRNAVEHAGDDITLRVGPLDDGFFVEDNGPGIPPDRREEVFKAGYSSNEEGTGLGLSIVKTIADAHGWSLSLAEGNTSGARFEITGVDLAD
jgi:PAS domain S-box-containing protein